MSSRLSKPWKSLRTSDPATSGCGDVITTAIANAAIRGQVRYIVEEQQAPQNAAEWLDRVWTTIDGLEVMPLRFPQAEGYRQKVTNIFPMWCGGPSSTAT